MINLFLDIVCGTFILFCMKHKYLSVVVVTSIHIAGIYFLGLEYLLIVLAAMILLYRFSIRHGSWVITQLFKYRLNHLN